MHIINNGVTQIDKKQEEFYNLTIAIYPNHINHHIYSDYW